MQAIVNCFDDMREQDVAEILTQFKPLSNEKLDAIAKEVHKDNNDGDDDEDKEGPPKTIPLSIAKLEKWTS